VAFKAQTYFESDLCMSLSDLASPSPFTILSQPARPDLFK